MPYCIRPMQREDLAQVTEIDREAFPTQWPAGDYRHELDNQLARYIVAYDDSKSPGQAGARIEPAPVGLASRLRWWLRHNPPFGNGSRRSDGQHIIGFAGIWVLADEAHITNIAVRKRYQRQGLGELLLIAISDLARQMKASVITLEVRISNTPAQDLYRKYGFTEVGTRRAYYTDNREDALIMTTDNINSDTFQARLQQLKQAHSARWRTPAVC